MIRGHTLKCDRCGKFVGYGDIVAGVAKNVMLTPDSAVSGETWETLCWRCMPIEAREDPAKKEKQP